MLVSPVLAEIVLTITKTFSRTWAAKHPPTHRKNSVPSVSARRRDSNDDDDIEMELVRENYGKCSDSKALEPCAMKAWGRYQERSDRVRGLHINQIVGARSYPNNNVKHYPFRNPPTTLENIVGVCTHFSHHADLVIRSSRENVHTSHIYIYTPPFLLPYNFFHFYSFFLVCFFFGKNT